MSGVLRATSGWLAVVRSFNRRHERDFPGSTAPSPAFMPAANMRVAHSQCIPAARPAPAHYGTDKTDAMWRLQKVRKILDTPGQPLRQRHGNNGVPLIFLFEK
jgi:hypothetical protein